MRTASRPPPRGGTQQALNGWQQKVKKVFFRSRGLCYEFSYALEEISVQCVYSKRSITAEAEAISASHYGNTLPKAHSQYSFRQAKNVTNVGIVSFFA